MCDVQNKVTSNPVNVHHLELFYYVAKHAGISEACKRIPYGVQQPAVSIQVGRLEEELGTKLFDRRPFRLTEAGKLVFEHISPFFEGMDDLAELVRGRITSRLRIVGLSEVMREHLADIVCDLTQKDKRLKISLKELDQAGCEDALLAGNADIAISVLPEVFNKGINYVELISLPIGFLVRGNARVAPTQASLLKALAQGTQKLVCLPEHELITRIFTSGAKKRGLRIAGSVTVTSQDIVTIYAKSGLGVALAAYSPAFALDSEMVFVPLEGFKDVRIGAFWKGDITPPAKKLLHMLQAKVKLLKCACSVGAVKIR